MKLAHIVGVAENGVIGLDGKLPWHISADLKYFKNKTMNSCIIMGRKTFDSIGKALPKRYSVVVTRQKDYVASGATVVHSIDEALAACEEAPSEFAKSTVFVIGGSELYKESMTATDVIFLTRIHLTPRGDTYYPDPTKYGFRLLESVPGSENGVEFSFDTYVR